MLVLTRQEHQAIQIGDDIEIVVISIEATVVRLGIRTSQSVTVDRQKIHEKRKKAEEKESSGAE